MNRRQTTEPEHVTAGVAMAAQDRVDGEGDAGRSEPTDHGKLRGETPEATYYEDAVRMPGYREPPDRCRDRTPVGVCREGHVLLGRSSCGARYCPDHWRDGVEDAVVAMVARLGAYRHVQEGAQKRLSPVVASPPQDRRYSVRGLWEMRGDAYEAFEAAGIRGGAAVVHPYRTNDRGDDLYAAAQDAGAVPEDTGRWAFLREVAGEDWEELEQYIEPAPHLHGLAAAEDIDGEAAPEGWIVKRIRKFKPFFYRDTRAYRDMVSHAYYLLTHAAQQRGRQAITYWGEVHPAAFDPEEELTAAVWDRVQREAEKAVKTRPDEHLEEVGRGSAGPEECPQEECTAAVVDVAHLPDLLEDEDWVASVRSQRDGEARYRRLMGVLLWWEGRCDTPPPSAATSRARFREWLEEIGRVHVPEPSQVSLSTAVMG